MGSLSVEDHRKILFGGIKAAYDNGLIKSKALKDMNEAMHFQTTHGYRLNYDPHVNGHFYIFMQPGIWTQEYLNQESNDEILLGDSGSGKMFENFYRNAGISSYDIDIPALNIEYESFSSRTKNLNHATKVSLTGDFSIKYLEEQTMTNFRHHAAWIQYIEALKKGYIKSPGVAYSDTSEFAPMSYYNTVWVILFDMFGTNIRGCVKIMGVSPVNFPIKDVMGDRAQANMSTVTCNYKCNDMVYTFFEDDANGSLIKEANEAFQSSLANSLTSTQTSLVTDSGGGGTITPTINNGTNNAGLSNVTPEEFDQLVNNEFNIPDAQTFDNDVNNQLNELNNLDNVNSGGISSTTTTTPEEFDNLIDDEFKVPESNDLDYDLISSITKIE